MVKSIGKEKSYRFSVKVIKFIDQLEKSISSDTISRQLVRSATSIGANIHEAQSCPTRKDFSHFLSHALKSSHETSYWLHILKDSGKGRLELLNELIEENEDISKILGASLVTLKKSGQ